MFDDDPVGVALRDAHPPISADAVWSEVLRRVRRGRRVRRALASLSAMALIAFVAGVVALRGDDASRTITVIDDPSRTVTRPGGVDASVAQTAVPSTVPVGQAQQFRIEYDTSQRFAFTRTARVVPDRVVTIDSHTIALEWTSACNQPAARVVIDQRTRTEIELLIGTFVIIDCIGEPTRWHIVLPIPEPLAADVVAIGPDGQAAPVRLDRLDNATREVIRNDFTTPVLNTQYTSSLGGSRRFDNRCSRVRITRISNGIEAFYQIEQADNPTVDCASGPNWVPFTQ